MMTDMEYSGTCGRIVWLMQFGGEAHQQTGSSATAATIPHAATRRIYFSGHTKATKPIALQRKGTFLGIGAGKEGIRGWFRVAMFGGRKTSIAIPPLVTAMDRACISRECHAEWGTVNPSLPIAML
jgi:hypothetical protein